MIDLGDYTLDADSRCFILCRKVPPTVKKKNGEPGSALIGYYRTLDGVAVKLATLSAHDAIQRSADVADIHLSIMATAARVAEQLAQHIALEPS